MTDDYYDVWYTHYYNTKNIPNFAQLCTISYSNFRKKNIFEKLGKSIQQKRLQT